MKNKLSIIIPIYNEKSFLKRLFTDLFQVFNDSYVEYIIINDGSSDGGELWLEKHLRPISDKKIKNLVVNDNNTFQLQATESKDDKYYSCLWGGSRIDIFKDKKLHDSIALDVKNPTCCCFGGPNLNKLMVTSAQGPLTLLDMDINGIKETPILF